VIDCHIFRIYCFTFNHRFFHRYNGTPRGLRNCNEGGCARCNGSSPSGQALDECVCLHAEENALLEAGHERVGEGAVLYCNTQVLGLRVTFPSKTDQLILFRCPCLRCTVKIIQTGVKEVIYNLSYKV
jgi:dCMP deaminase